MSLPLPLITTTPFLPSSRRAAFRRALFLLIVFVFLPAARAVTPAPDGGYSNQNTAEGTDALFSLQGGSSNTALGFNALHDNTTGGQNTATGNLALANNIDGGFNTATGNAVLGNNTSGENNTAIGAGALSQNTIGSQNTATGNGALIGNIEGGQNTATGLSALLNNTGGNRNTALGMFALFGNGTGNNNIGVGFNAGANLTDGNSNIVIGHPGAAGDAKTIRIGKQGTHLNTQIAGIRGTVIADGQQVLVNANGRLGVAGASSARFKQAIKPMAKSSESLYQFEPVNFRYNEEIDSEGRSQYGLIAEQVEKVDPALVERDEEGKAFSVRYDAVNAMLLNEFLKEHRRNQEQARAVQELKATVARQNKEAVRQQDEIKALAASLKEQAAETRKVSAQMATGRRGVRQ